MVKDEFTRKLSAGKYPGKCEACGAEFVGVNPHRRFCSDDCRIRAHTRKKGTHAKVAAPKHDCDRCGARAAASIWRGALPEAKFHLCRRCFALWERRWLNATRDAGISDEETLALMQFHVDEGRASLVGDSPRD